VPQTPFSAQALLGEDLTAWTWWWEMNKEPYLVVDRGRSRTRPTTGSEQDLLGRHASDAQGRAVSDAELFGNVVPALLRTLREDHPDRLIAATAIALARLGSTRAPTARSAYSEVLRTRLPEASEPLTESLLLALGILGSEADAPTLAGVLLSTREARELLGTTRISPRTRAMAAYALGLVGEATENEDVRRYVVHQLVWCLETDRSASVDLDAACINALGITPIGPGAQLPTAKRGTTPPGSSLTAQVDYLLDLLKEHRRDALVRAQIPLAIGRLLQSSRADAAEALRVRAVDELLDRIAAHRREPRELVQSCVIALGQIADSDGDEADRRARRVLMRIPEIVNDIAARELSLIALGRACSRSGNTDADSVSELREERAYLLGELAGGSTLMRGWAALGLGVWLRETNANEDSLRALRHALEAARADLDVGAFAISLGLARDDDAAEPLLDGLDDRGEPTTRGRLALAIGLAQSDPGRVPLLELVPRTLFQPPLLHDASLSLCLLGTDEVTPILVAMLGRAQSLASQAAVCAALARTRDARALAPLLALFDDARRSTAIRAVAVEALGRLGDPRDVPRSALYSIDANLHAAPGTLFSSDGSGILTATW